MVLNGLLSGMIVCTLILIGMRIGDYCTFPSVDLWHLIDENLVEQKRYVSPGQHDTLNNSRLKSALASASCSHGSTLD